MDIEVVPERVRYAGQAMGEAAHGASRVTPYDELAAVPAALPGGLAAPVAVALGERWRRLLEGWVRAGEVHGRALALGAEDYRELELAVVGLLAAVAPDEPPRHHRDPRAGGSWTA